MFAARVARTTGAEPSRPVSANSWARALLNAPVTRPGDLTERAADRDADAALGSESVDRPGPAASGASSAGTPPWGAGRSLTRAERAWHEPRTGADLGDVRVHEGPAPARWARVLGARAFTFGRDVVLGPDAYAPGTRAGRHLLAHELSHAVAGRGRPPVLARVALTAADYDALADSIHAAVGSASADEELVYVALQKLERDPTAVAALKAAYKKKFTTELLADLATRLKGNGLGLARTLLGEAKGLAVAAAAPSTPAQFEGLSRAVNTALVAKPVDPEGVYAALLPLGRAATAVATVKSKYKTLFSVELEADLTAKLTGADLSYALYLLDAPGPAATHTPSVTYTARPAFGASATTGTVTGGTVSADTAVPYSYQPSDPSKPVASAQFGFGYGYSGALSADSRWLQFIEREIDATVGGKTAPVPGNVTVRTNTYPLTTNRSSPSWFLDSYSASNPFFDETHPNESLRDATSVSAFDSPSAIESMVAAQFSAGATAVTSRAHFDIYLVRDFAPIHHFEVEIVWTYSSPTKRTTSRRVLSSGAAGSLPPAQKTALTSRYPAYAYIR